MKRKDNFVYHKKLRIRTSESSKDISKIRLSCPNQGKNLPKSVGLKCPICHVQLRTRCRSPGKRKDKRHKRRNTIIALTYIPHGTRHRENEQLFLIERVPQIRERISNLKTIQAFRVYNDQKSGRLKKKRNRRRNFVRCVTSLGRWKTA